MAKGSFGLAWQTQMALVGLIGVGGYFAWVNRFPPFDEGGLIDQLSKYLPKHKGKGASAASDEGNSNDGSDSGSGSDGIGGLDPNSVRAAQSPFPTGSTVLPNGNIFNPALGGMQLPGNGGIPNQQMQTSRASDPTSGEMNVYDNYIKALQLQFGAQNRANLGPGGAPPGTVGDPNLGTTPVPNSLFQPQGPQNYMPMNPPGYPPMGGQPSQFGRPSMPPGAPFLPNPTQYTGPVQPGPYPAHPPVQRPPPPIPQGPYPPTPPYGYPPYPRPYGGFAGIEETDSGHHRGAPFFNDVNEVYGINVGDIHVGLDGIRIGDLINIAGNERDIFPHGVDRYDKGKFEKDVSSYVNRLLKKVQGKSSKAKTKALKQLLQSALGGGYPAAGGLGGPTIFSGAGFILPDKAAYQQMLGTNSLQPYIKKTIKGAKDLSYRFRLGNQR